MRRHVVLLTLAALAATPSTAAAQAPIEAPAPPPVQTQMKLAIEGAGGKLATTLVGSTIRVRGTVGAYVPGERVTVRFFGTNFEKLRSKRMTIQRSPDGTTGRFALSYKAERSGELAVRATHEATAALGALKAKARAIDVIPRSVGPRSRKRAVRALQRRLSRLGYVVGERGNFDARTARAVLAFRKVSGMRRTYEASVDVMRRIARGGGVFKIRHADHGRHIEADLSRQVIALIAGGKVQRIYPVSSGKFSTSTVTGSFRVYSKTPGTNAKGMVHSAYFHGGYATHGYPSVPVYPASHGCLRVPIPDALSLFRWIKIGTPVDVYYGKS